MRVLEDLHVDLENMAGEIARVEPDPERWDTPLIYLIQSLEMEAVKTTHGDLVYEKMIEKVRDALSDWLEEERW